MFDFEKVTGIIFDLDDTLVHARLDFDKMKKEIGCAKDTDILAFIAALECEKEKHAAEQVVLAHELADANTSALIDGALDFILKAQKRNIPTAIVTRNCKQATAIKLHKNKIPIEDVITREDAKPKPDPEALLAIATKWQMPTINIAYIGDYDYDIQAAHNANMQAWLFTHRKNRRYEDQLSFIPQ